MDEPSALCHACLDDFSADGPCPGCAAKKARDDAERRAERLLRAAGDVVDNARFFPMLLAQLRAVMPPQWEALEKLCDRKETQRG